MNRLSVGLLRDLPVESAAPASEVDRAQAFVQVDDASLRYAGDEGGLPAIEGVTLEIGRGEFAAVVGPSGCGKSTLMKLVSGLAPASTGRVTVDGQAVRGPIKIVGMAFQNPCLLPWRTALENILLPIQIVRPHRRQYRRDRAPFVDAAQALLGKVGLSGIGDRYAWELSGGMQQRVSLCRALIHDPQILLLDEPFGALDAFTREELWDTLQSLWQQRRCTVLLVTHDLVEAVYLADTIHVMSSRPGRVIHTTRIGLPRPRFADMRYRQDFVGCVHDIRTHIGRARGAA